MNMFHIGDYVRAISVVGSRDVENACGFIRDLSDGQYLIEFDEDIGGHEGSFRHGNTRPGHGWWVFSHDIEIVNTDTSTKKHFIFDYLF